MNENNFNVNTQPVAPAAPVQPVAPVVPAAPIAPAAPVVVKQPMDKKEIMKWIGVGCGIAVALSAFIPYISMFGASASIWDSGKLSAIIVALFGIIAALTYFFGKAKGFSLLAAGVASWYGLNMFESFDWGFDGLALGFWLMLLGGITLFVINVLENIDEIKSLFGTSNPPTPNAPVAPKAPIAPVVPVQPVAPAVTPVQPATPTVPAVEPVVPVAPVVPTVEPVVQAAVVCSNCGQPKKNPMDQFCQNCGQKY